jgi:hypothetical protein
MAIKAGTVADFENSMAEAIEDALKAEWSTVKEIDFPNNDPEDRRLLFVAIAQGIVRYLKDNAEFSIVVHSVNVTQNDADIDVSGPSGGPSTGIYHTHSVNVDQVSGAGNRVVSTGSGKIRLETTGDLH